MPSITQTFQSWLKPDAAGLCCAPGAFHIDPTRAVERAIITHGHSDHARPGHGAVLATPEAIADRTHLIGAYGLGKTQRIIALLRAHGYERPIWLHGANQALCDLYVALGVDLGELRLVSDATDKLPGEIVLCPPSALKDRWTRRLTDPVSAFASGWMRVRARARQVGVELPLVISDHCDWPELIATIAQTQAE